MSSLPSKVYQRSCSALEDSESWTPVVEGGTTSNSSVRMTLHAPLDIIIDVFRNHFLAYEIFNDKKDEILILSLHLQHPNL